MFRKILTKPEQIIFDVLTNQTLNDSFDLNQMAQKHMTPTDKIIRYIKNWLQQSTNTDWKNDFHLTKQHLYLRCSPARRLDLLAHLFQCNQSFQILHAIIEQPFATIKHLANNLYLSPSTVKRQIKKLSAWFTPYQIQVSLQHDPILKGCEFRIRWLCFILSLMFDPPFNWFCRHELCQRFEDIQIQRLHYGQNLNALPIDKITFDYNFSFIISEKAWHYVVRQLFGLEETILSVKQFSFLTEEPTVTDFLVAYQEFLLNPSTHYEMTNLVAEN